MGFINKDDNRSDRPTT